jgi:hypothetical protein
MLYATLQVGANGIQAHALFFNSRMFNRTRLTTPVREVELQLPSNSLQGIMLPQGLHTPSYTHIYRLLQSCVQTVFKHMLFLPIPGDMVAQQ